MTEVTHIKYWRFWDWLEWERPVEYGEFSEGTHSLGHPLDWAFVYCPDLVDDYIAEELEL